MVPWTGAGSRRARHLIPKGLPRRGELLAAGTVAILLAHLMLAQLTLVLAVAFVLVSRASRWRLWWLLAPAAAGLAWTLVIGPDRALAGFTAGPSGILWHLGGGHLAGEAGHPFAGFGGAQHWLPRQFPVALVAGAAEAALAGWLDWLHTDEWAVPPPRPGLVAAARRGLAARAIRSGAVVTRDGCALGVVPSTGGIAELRWAELTGGALVAGAAAQDVTLAGLQVIHAALRRRKPVIVFDCGDAAVGRAVATACRATGTPLLAAGLAGDASVDLGRVVRERLAALVPAGSDELAGRACGDLALLAADLRRIGVDGDALVWVPHGERVPPPALAALVRDDLPVLVGTASPRAAAELSGLVGTALVYRVTDRDLAARLAARTGTRLLPAPGADAAASDLVPGPVIPAPVLLALGRAEFVLAVSAPRPRLIASGRMVPARLPSRPAMAGPGMAGPGAVS